MRTPIIAGNWKMHKTVDEAVQLVNEIRDATGNITNVEIVVCPPYTALYAVNRALRGSKIGLSAQDVFWKEQGAYTSQISPKMLTDVGCKYSIIGHSETRGRFGVPEPELEPVLSYFSETDDTINIKAKACFANGLIPIICVGETLAEREAGKTDDVIKAQVKKDLEGLSADQAKQVVLAYEPVWAIGTGKVCDSPEAQRVCGMIRSTIADFFGKDVADAVRIQYGGSVKPDNAAELLSQPDIDGALVGGASLKSADFVAIIKSA